MVEFYKNWYVNEFSQDSPFEVSYGFQSATPADRFLSLTDAHALDADRQTELSNVRDVVR